MSKGGAMGVEESPGAKQAWEGGAGKGEDGPTMERQLSRSSSAEKNRVRDRVRPLPSFHFPDA